MANPSQNREHMDEFDYSVQDVQFMSKNYEGAKLRCVVYPRKRPSFMKQMGVSLKDYDATGFIDYNRELVMKIDADDANYIEQYAEDMHTVWVLEHGIAAIQDENTRAIAEDTLLKGKSCAELEKKYGIKACAIRRRKRRAVEFISTLV